MRKDDNAFIEFRNISKNYKNFKALDNISFKIEEGEIFGYIGPNGAGKTTTIKILVGLIRQFQGQVLVEGNAITDIRNQVHRILGYLPQESGFQEWRTVDHALKTFGRLSGLTRHQVEMRIPQVLELVNLEDVRHKKIMHLSGGMAQKLRLAQALIHEPKLLVLDEPMSGLDPTSRYQMRTIIKDLSKQGKTILFSSHILADVQDIATKIGIINKGRILTTGSPTELQNMFQVNNIVEINLEDKINSINVLETIPGIESIEQVSTTKFLVRISLKSDIDVCIHQILKKCLESKWKIRNFNVLKPSLEDVYLKYVEGDST